MWITRILALIMYNAKANFIFNINIDSKVNSEFENYDGTEGDAGN